MRNRGNQATSELERREEKKKKKKKIELYGILEEFCKCDFTLCVRQMELTNGFS